MCEQFFAYDQDCLGDAKPENKKALPSDEVAEMLIKQHSLTCSEARVFRLLARGYSYKHIAQNLGLSVSTVTTQGQTIYRKFNVHKKDDLIMLVERCFLSQPC